MLTVYRVSVYFRGNMKVDNHLWVEKEVIKCRVVKAGRDYLYLSKMPEGSYGLDPLKVPVSECYSSLEEAQRHADEKASELITKLMEFIAKLKGPAKVFDRISEPPYETKMNMT